MFPTKIQVHREQDKLINAQSYQYEGTRLNMHVTMHNTADQTFWIFFMEVEDLGIWSSASIRACIFPSLSSLLWLHEVNDGGGSLFRLCFQWFFSLWHLDISYEYLINQRDNGDDWPKIAHIPYIRIDSNVIAVL